MILISNLTLYVSDGSTIASTEIYGADKKTYINIGSGNVFKLTWTTPLVTNDDVVDHYTLVIKRHDTSLDVYYNIFDRNVGLVNEFYVDSALLPSAPLQYVLSIYIVAYGKLGSVITSNVVNPYISKGSGSYVKVTDNNYKQPIMKRALAFVKELPTARTAATHTLTDSDTDVVLTDINGVALQDIDGNTLTLTAFDLVDCNGTALLDANQKVLFASATQLLESTNNWHVVQESYTRDTSNNWQVNSIKYETLVDSSGELIEDINNEPIYVL